MKKNQKIKALLYAMIIVFILIVSFFLIPEEIPFRRGLFIAVAVLGFIFLILGILLSVLSLNEKGKLKAFLLLTGLSATAPLLGSILHNVFYGLAITFTNLAPLFEFLHGAFFIIALLIAPIGFIIGMIGSLVLLRKK